MCSGDLVIFFIRFNVTIRNVVPMITCRPWNPVATKNVVPNTESVNVYGASIYSIACKAVNSNPSRIVVINVFSLFFFSFIINLWWDHVIEAPEEIRTNVFNNGTFNGLNGLIIFGGHSCPSSIVGEILLWKNAQKNATKNKTSDVMNSSIPNCSPLFTFLV